MCVHRYHLKKFGGTWKGVRRVNCDYWREAGIGARRLTRIALHRWGLATKAIGYRLTDTWPRLHLYVRGVPCPFLNIWGVIYHLRVQRTKVPNDLVFTHGLPRCNSVYDKCFDVLFSPFASPLW